MTPFTIRLRLMLDQRPRIEPLLAVAAFQTWLVVDLARWSHYLFQKVRLAELGRG
jgi:hypothetical protein